MDGYDGVDEAGEQAAGEYGVFFDELGKVVETGGWLGREVNFNALFLERSPDCDFKNGI